MSRAAREWTPLAAAMGDPLRGVWADCVLAPAALLLLPLPLPVALSPSFVSRPAPLDFTFAFALGFGIDASLIFLASFLAS